MRITQRGESRESLAGGSVPMEGKGNESALAWLARQ